MPRILSRAMLMSGVAMCILPSASAYAANDGSSFGLDEIVVTAERRSTNLQKVAISITAMQGDTLSKLQISTAEDLSKYTPSLHIFAEATGSEFYTIRGIGRANEDLSSDSGVAVFLNDVYIARQSAANVAFFDVERVEVLRGPQGTLYGKNAVGGAINILSRKPTDEFSGYGSIEYGNFNRLNIEGAMSGPLVEDKLSARIAFVSKNRDGIYENLTTGEDGNNIDTQGLRGTLSYKPSADFEATLIADWVKTEQDGVLKSVIVDVPGTPYILKDFYTVSEFPTQEENIRSTRSGTHGSQGVEAYGAALQMGFFRDDVDITSITGYRKEMSHHQEDNDHAAERSGEVSSTQDTWTFSQELRIVSKDGGALSMGGDLSWTAGLYWFHEEGDRLQNRYSDFYGPGGLQGPGSPEVMQSTSHWDTNINTDAYAAFGQASYQLTDIFSLTGGLRYTYEKKAFAVNAYALPLTPGGDPYSLFQPAGDFVTTSSESWERWTPKVGIEAQISDDIMAYLTYSHGFKSGGFDGQPSGPNLTPFRPEKVINYEAGIKSRAFDGRLQANLSVFYSDFTDLQQQGFNAQGIPITTNAADAEVKGLELEVDVQPVENLLISGGLSMIDPEYSSYFIEVFDPTIQGGPPFRLVDKAGDRIGLIPKYSFNLRGQYTVPLDDGGALRFEADMVGVGNTITEFDTLWSDSYEVYNAGISWLSPDERWEASLWMRNITDKPYYRGSGPVPDLNDKISRLGLINDPQTYGITVKMRFGG